MKKFEAALFVQVRVALAVLSVLGAGVSHAQDVPEPSAPPLVPEEMTVPEEADPSDGPPDLQGTPPPPGTYAPEPNAQGVLQPKTIANAPLPPEETQQSTTPSRLPRIGMEALIGVGAGAIGAVAGGFIGHATLREEFAPPLGSTWFGASIGFAVLAPVAVWLVGKWFDGNGAWWATLLGDLAGSAFGVFAVIFGGAEATPVLFALPLAGSMIGYEVTSDAKASTPRVSIGFGTKNGTSSVSLMGSF